MSRFKVHGYWYGGRVEEGTDREGYLHFWDVVEAENEQEAKEIALEDYGDFNTVEVHGIVKSNADEKRWVAKNES